MVRFEFEWRMVPSSQARRTATHRLESTKTLAMRAAAMALSVALLCAVAAVVTSAAPDAASVATVTAANYEAFVR